jgi:hypothetical protein
VAAGIVSAFETFRSKTLDLASGVQVAAEFLSTVVPVCQPAITAEYFKAALKVLQHGRPETAEAVHRALAAAMEHGMESLPKKQASPIRRQMGALLKPPEREVQRVRYTPISHAVRILLALMRQAGEPPGK